MVGSTLEMQQRQTQLPDRVCSLHSAKCRLMSKCFCLMQVDEIVPVHTSDVGLSTAKVQCKAVTTLGTLYGPHRLILASLND